MNLKLIYYNILELILLQIRKVYRGFLWRLKRLEASFILSTNVRGIFQFDLIKYFRINSFTNSESLPGFLWRLKRLEASFILSTNVRGILIN